VEGVQLKGGTVFRWKDSKLDQSCGEWLIKLVAGALICFQYFVVSFQFFHFTFDLCLALDFSFMFDCASLKFRQHIFLFWGVAASN